MLQTTQRSFTKRYARCIQNSKRARWDIDKDVIRGRTFDHSKKFLPDGLSKANNLDFLNADEKTLLSQVQGRTYANIFGLVERFINAKVLEVSRDHWFGDQIALEALVRFSDEELKHQALFRRIEQMIASGMSEGYTLVPNPNDVASVVLGKSTWAVLGLTCHIELFTLSHYKQSIAPDENLSELFKDVFLYHWREESQHAVLDELEWVREDAKLTDDERDHAVNDLIELIAAVDSILQMQSPVDAAYFVKLCNRSFRENEETHIANEVLGAYRWQYIVSGVQEPRFIEILSDLVNETQLQRISAALRPIM